MLSNDFDTMYRMILHALNEQGKQSTTRKGSVITELFDCKFVLNAPMECWAFCRKPSLDYLKGELDFYLGGSNLVKDAVKISKFWENCTDDGETINSNYGKLLFHDRNKKGFTQFGHAFNCLKNNPQSKKAVMTLYEKENAYISNDNPCTMYLRVRIDSKKKVHMTTVMRSSDVYFGLPYDVPFFVFVQYAMMRKLDSVYSGLSMGTYTHFANSLHKYEYKEKELAEALFHTAYVEYPMEYKIAIEELFEKDYKKLEHLTEASGTKNPYMINAWEIAKESKCLKKKVGGVLVTKDGQILAKHYGSPLAENCKKCVRDTKSDKYYGDECPSVHSEMKCIVDAYQQGYTDFSEMTVYITHGPCDACLKLCDLVGIRTVVYDQPYKTDYSHWPRIKVIQVEEYDAAE